MQDITASSSWGESKHLVEGSEKCRYVSSFILTLHDWILFVCYILGLLSSNVCSDMPLLTPITKLSCCANRNSSAFKSRFLCRRLLLSGCLKSNHPVIYCLCICSYIGDESFRKQTFEDYVSHLKEQAKRIKQNKKVKVDLCLCKSLFESSICQFWWNF